MKYQLRDYQAEAVDAAMREFNKPAPSPFIIVAATAAGKSLIISEIANQANGKVLVLQPNKEILLQNYEKMMSYGLDVDVTMYSASVKTKEVGHITFATIGTIYKNPELFQDVEVVIIDECHQVDPKSFKTDKKGIAKGMYAKLIRGLKTRKICGLTATPYRMDNKFFGDEYTGCVKMLNRIAPFFFRSIAYKIEMADLLARGYLAPLEYHLYDNDTAELLKLNKGKTNYDDDSVENWTASRMNSFVALAPTFDKHKRVLVFCSSVAQSEKAVERLAAIGIHAETVSADTKPKDRDDMLARFKAGELRWIVNVGVLTTGFDAPVLDAVVMLRPTMSVALYVQMVGRCVRLDPNDPNKVGHLYDLTGTVQKFGRVETIRVQKEGVFKDMLVGEYGRIDDRELFRFKVDKEGKHKALVSKEHTPAGPPTLHDLLNMV